MFYRYITVVLHHLDIMILIRTVVANDGAVCLPTMIDLLKQYLLNIVYCKLAILS